MRPNARSRQEEGGNLASSLSVLKKPHSSKPVEERKEQMPMCDVHEDEKINIYCVTHAVPTCSMCKIFGAHKDCEVSPITSIYQTKKVTPEPYRKKKKNFRNLNASKMSQAAGLTVSRLLKVFNL